MTNDLLGAALGRCLSQLSGLSAAYLPDGLDEAIGTSVVRSANARRPGSPPYAILVAVGPEDTVDPGCVRLAPNNAIKYRQGDRLAVVAGRHPDLESFVQSFRQLVDQDYPSPGATGPDLDELASAALDEVIRAAGIPATVAWPRTPATSRLAKALRQLEQAHRALGQGTLSWNVYWFHHVATGLRVLADGLREVAESQPTLSLADAFADLTYAAFALPRPSDGMALSGGAERVGKDIAEALASWWADADTIQTTIQQLEHHPDTMATAHPLGQVDWSGFGRTLAAEDNHLIALLRHRRDMPNRLAAFAALSESHFFNPLATITDTKHLNVAAVDGTSLSVVDNRPTYAVPTAGVEVDGAGCVVRSTELRVQIRQLAPIDRPTLERSGLRITSSDRRTTWSGHLELAEDGTTWAVGHLERAVGKTPFAMPVRAMTLSVTVPASDPLAGKVAATGSATIYLLPPTGPGVAWFRVGPSSLGRPGSIGPERYQEDGTPTGVPSSEVAEVTPTERFALIVWGCPGPAPAIGGRALDPWGPTEGHWSTVLVPSGSDSLVVGETSIEFTSAEQGTPYQSPVIAAITRGAISALEPQAETQSSIRGRLESCLAREHQSEAWSRALGHVVLPRDRSVDVEPLVPHMGGAVLAHPSIAGMWNAVSDFMVPAEIVECEAANDFRRAFKDLGVSGSLSMSAGASSGLAWPSRTSWRHLWEDRDALARYLESYAELVSFAQASGDPAATFWASYPFSASVWDTQQAGRCRAALLSPLHPIRLAWIACAEWTLWEADDPGVLAGSIEGWNFPMVGPRDTTAGRMLAVPLDNGEEQVFLGWSMLVDVSIDAPEPLRPPVRIANLPAPGASASGLNAASVIAALKDYRRVNPHVSTMTVDLAAAAPTTRLDEVDEAILSAMAKWASDSTGLLSGGVRVRDSLNRQGDAPRDEVAKLVTGQVRVPISWSRYRPDAQRTEECNVRLLQDAGIRLQVSDSSAPTQGVVGGAPLRRFEANPPDIKDGKSLAHPTLRTDSGWEPFANALRTVERANQRPEVVSKLFQALLIDERADWTVSGESMMSPAALGKLVAANSNGSQMLWEWRPPFLVDKPAPGNPTPSLEKRPFVSVVRVPSGFRIHLRQLLTQARATAASDSDVSELLAMLGARGVGLSSLTAMGGTHAAGAIGFYLAIAMLEQATDPGYDQIVLPIDACDSFLKALAGQGATAASSTRRADLLVARIEPTGITLVPIEIKLYGLLAGEPSQHLPNPGDAVLNDPAEQLTATTSQLRSIEVRSRELLERKDSADSHLWHNGLLTLVEAGLRLRPGTSDDRDRLAAQVQRLANGQMPLRVGKPVLAFFGHGAQAASGHVAHTDALQPSRPELGTFAALMASPAQVFDDLAAGDGPALASWRTILDSAMAHPITRESAPIPALPRPDETATERGLELQPTPTSGAPWPRDKAHLPPATELPAPHDGASGADGPVSPPTPLAQPTHLLGDGVRFPVGQYLDSVAQADATYWPSNTDLNQMNIGVVGDLGTGKTQLLKQLIANLRREAAAKQPTPLSLLIFDYKRDYQDETFVKAVDGTVLLPFHIPLNVFALPGAYTPLAAFQKAQAFIDILSRIYGGIGPVQRDRLSKAIVELFKAKSGQPPTLSEVLQAYEEKAGGPDAVVGVLNPFVLGEVFSDEPAQLQPFESLLSDRVLVVALSELGNDQNMKNALVVLFLNLYYEHMLRLRKWPYETTPTGTQLRRLNSYLLVDEATNIMRYEFTVLSDLMLQGREFGVGVILASQYLSHFKEGQTNYGQPLRTWFIHRVPAVTKQQLVQLGIPNASDATATSIATLGIHEALFSSLGVAGRLIRGKPFYELASGGLLEAP